MQGVHPYHVAELAGGVALPSVLVGGLEIRMSEFLGRRVRSVRHACLHLWVVGTAGGDDDAGIFGEVGA